MKLLPLFLLLFLSFGCGTFRDVSRHVPPRVFTISPDGKCVIRSAKQELGITAETLTSMLHAEIQRSEPMPVQLNMPKGLPSQVVDRYLDACRKAGVVVLTVEPYPKRIIMLLHIRGSRKNVQDIADLRVSGTSSRWYPGCSLESVSRQSPSPYHVRVVRRGVMIYQAEYTELLAAWDNDFRLILKPDDILEFDYYTEQGAEGEGK